MVISGTGLFTPPHVITNFELVESYNAYVDNFNTENSTAIEQGKVVALQHSNSEFIEKASGIKQRYAMYKEGLLDIKRMLPLVPRRSSDELSICAEMAIAAATEALNSANKRPEDIDLVICGSSTTQRAWPAVAIEIQQALGCSGYAYDMSVACSTATFGISNAIDAISSGMARHVLVVNPEYITPQINYRDRDTHFIFGDVATAVIVEKAETATGEHLFEVLHRKLKTSFSNNIRNDFSYITRAEPNLTLERFFEEDQWFKQQGRKVFKELLPLVCHLIKSQLDENGIEATQLRRMWLHQANINMNNFTVQKLLGRKPQADEAPIVLDTYANTASAGAIIAFHLFHGDLIRGDKGLICSFGAGYSIGSLLVEKI